ncbi:hypothetical protein H9L12_09500 [Sphingomonas rhizophila]|uniref:Uncharacterized protein n=1 Tax=Sphingomonas rhizophila TaxID=2071607 RepID=A0A7G9S9L2_9SPHN|nr:DUF6334 family protein [Sphingomonas rhizophila]QNN64537.1 hypothetical protein H9L12_09500 [Sphingomonas rhizophila]
MEKEFTCLRFDWGIVNGEIVRSVVGEPADGCHYWRVAIPTDKGTVVIAVDEDTDQVWVSLTDEDLKTEAWKPVPFLQDWVNVELGWCWVGINYLGYKDTFSLSCDAPLPQWAFVGEGSSLTCYQMRGPRESVRGT